MDSCFLGHLFFLYSSRDHSLDPSHLAKDGLDDNNPVAVDLGADSPEDSGACYFLTDSFALPKIDSACHSL
jgi:hypothetical protein